MDVSDLSGDLSSSRGCRESRRVLLTGILASSSITGLSRAASVSQRGLQVFWSLLFVGGVIGFGVNFELVMKEHLEEPVLTQMDHEYSKFSWPHVTFCNPSNPVAFWRDPSLMRRWSAVKRRAGRLRRRLRKGRFVVSREELGMSSVPVRDFFAPGVRGLVGKVEVYSRVSKTIARSSINFDGYREVRDFARAFEDRMSSSKIPLPCYTLRPERLFANESGIAAADIFSIKVSLILDFQSYLFFNYGYQNRKLYVYLTIPGGTLTSTEPYFVSAGTSSHFQISETHLQRIKNCNDRSFHVQIYSTNLADFRRYRGVFNDCRFNLSQWLYYEHCDCHTHLLPLYRYTDSRPRLCLNMSLFNASQIVANMRCLNRTRHRYSDGGEFERLLSSRCSDFLKPRCHQPSYSLIRRTNVWPAKMNANRRRESINAARQLPNTGRLWRWNRSVPITEEFVLLNCATVEFHRATEKSILTFEQLEYPLSELMSDVGGLLGLWLGLSVISVFECLELVVIFVLTLFTKLRRI